MNSPQHKDSGAPFERFVYEYREKGWDAIPLPPKKKRWPPKGVTGRKNKGLFPSDKQIEKWLDCRSSELDPETGKPRIPWALGNIGVRPGRVVEIKGRQYEALGIDLDDYGDKNGWVNSKKLEEKLGVLPDTWISSARTDRRSGIRWYLVPFGYEYHGQAAESIEIIQHVHRHGVVYPSYNPDAKAPYYWYEPGQLPNGIAYFSGVPNVKTLAILPDPWIEHLKKGVRQTSTESIDENISTKDLHKWAKEAMQYGSGYCLHTKHAIAKWLKDFAAGDDHHDPLVKGHWNLFLMGSEGHTGVLKAVNAMEEAWVKRLEEEGDSQTRSFSGAVEELKRSREEALRKIKARIDDGSRTLATVDPCTKPKNTNPPPPQNPSNTSQSNDPPSWGYERNEDGNAQHFLDLFGDRVRFMPNHPDGGKEGRWLVFLEDSKRWVVDHKNVMVRNMFREVKRRQIKDASDQLKEALRLGDTILEKRANAWLKWGTDSGNVQRVTNTLRQATTFDDITVMYQDMDTSPYLLPVANGIIKFHTKAEREAGAPRLTWVKDAEEIKGYMVTQNTGVPFIPLRKQAEHKDPTVRKNYETFVKQMHVFLKNHMSEAEWTYTLRLLGFSILGINPKKAIFFVGDTDTGKSTLQNMINAALGDLSIWREPQIFEDTPFKSALAEALTRRICMVGELGEKHVDAGLFKRITGNDEVSCNLKNINQPVTLRARCTIISGCNSAPEVPNVDDATKERFVVIPFRHRVPATEKDVEKQDELMEACKVPMLALLVQECCNGIELGIQGIPDELAMETKVFVSSLNELSDFVNDVLVQADPEDWKKYSRNDIVDDANPKPRWPDDKCLGDRTLYKEYEKYARRNNMDIMSKTKWSRRMKAAGFVQDGSWTKENEKRWIGISFKAGHSKMVEA